VKPLLAVALALMSFSAWGADPRPFVRGSWQEIRQEHSGRPMIVHFWGLTCGPCLVELPQWGEFIRDRPAAEIVMVAADPVVEGAPAIASMLAKAGCSDVESWMFTDPFTERLTYEIDPQWGGELPYTLLVGRDGSTTGILGKADFSQMREWAERQSARAAGGGS
jgi:thiol-disulfide isomerase/thioredoxin